MNVVLASSSPRIGNTSLSILAGHRGTELAKVGGFSEGVDNVLVGNVETVYPSPCNNGGRGGSRTQSMTRYRYDQASNARSE